MPNNEPIDLRIENIEAKLKEHGVTIPGTAITRVLMDAKLCQEEDITVPAGKEYRLVWSIGLGMMNMPKWFFVGITIEQALVRAESWIRDLDIGPDGRRKSNHDST